MIKIIDGHNDVLAAVYDSDKPRQFLARSHDGHIDLPRAQEGGLAGGFFAICAGSDPVTLRPTIGHSELDQAIDLAAPIETYHALRTSVGMLATLFRLEEASAGQLKVVRTFDEVLTCLDQGVLFAIAHLEGADAIDAQLNTLDVLYRAGLRSIGLVWSRPNIFGEGVPFRYPSSPDTGPGLSLLGRRLVKRCNELGILIDVSHLNAKGFWDVASLSAAPLVATHSNAHTITPHSRNLLDAELDAIRDSGGIVGVNFAQSFVRLANQSSEEASIGSIVEHFTYLIDRIGIDHVGFGSDFDGTTIPAEIGDVTGLSRVTEALSEQFSIEELDKVAHGNWLRVLEATWGRPGT